MPSHVVVAIMVPGIIVIARHELIARHLAAMPTMPAMAAIPISVLITERDIAEVERNANAVRTGCAGRRQSGARQAQRDNRAGQNLTHDLILCRMPARAG